jgi:hypothetical protein
MKPEKSAALTALRTAFGPPVAILQKTDALAKECKEANAFLDRLFASPDYS